MAYLVLNSKKLVLRVSQSVGLRLCHKPTRTTTVLTTGYQVVLGHAIVSGAGARLKVGDKY